MKILQVLLRPRLQIALIPFLLCVVGCGHITSSGVPADLNTDAPLLKAGRAQGIVFSSSAGGVSSGFSSVDVERRVSATITSGTPSQLMAALQHEIEQIINSRGGVINGTGVTGSGKKDVQDFSYSYSWRRTDGIIKAFSFPNTNNEVQIVIVCYEHAR